MAQMVEPEALSSNPSTKKPECVISVTSTPSVSITTARCESLHPEIAVSVGNQRRSDPCTGKLFFPSRAYASNPCRLRATPQGHRSTFPPAHHWPPRSSPVHLPGSWICSSIPKDQLWEIVTGLDGSWRMDLQCCEDQATPSSFIQH
jgi:hypothetical protein